MCREIQIPVLLSNFQCILQVPPKGDLNDTTENAERHTFKAPCCCFENAPYTELTIVCTINVSIDCKKNEVPNLNKEKNILDCNTRQSVALFVFVFKIIVYKDDDFSVLTATKFINENIEKSTMMYRVAMRNGIDCCNNPTLLIWPTIFDWMGLNCYI